MPAGVWKSFSSKPKAKSVVGKIRRCWASLSAARFGTELADTGAGCPNTVVSGPNVGGGASRQLQHVMARMHIKAVGQFIARVAICLMVATFASVGPQTDDTNTVLRNGLLEINLG